MVIYFTNFCEDQKYIFVCMYVCVCIIHMLLDIYFISYTNYKIKNYFKDSI